MKKILILTAGFGEGHNSAARGIRDGLLESSPADTRVEIHDLFAETYGALNEFVRVGYLHMINHAPAIWSHVYGWLDRREDFARSFRMLGRVKASLARLLDTWQPDVVVSVYPTYSHLLDEIVGPTGGRSPKRVVMITDSITINAIWYRCKADAYLVTNEETATVLRDCGVDPTLVHAFGFPVSPRFAHKGTSSRAADASRPRILHLVNARKREAPTLVVRLAAIPGAELTVVVGRDVKLRREIEKVRESSPRKFELVGWSDDLPELLTRSHLLISKAGGATVQEAIAAGCPMIVNHVVPGQEEGNARLLVQSCAGAWASSSDDVIRNIEEAFANDAALWREWQRNVQRMSHPAAALEIAQFLLRD